MQGRPGGSDLLSTHLLSPFFPVRIDHTTLIIPPDLSQTRSTAQVSVVFWHDNEKMSNFVSFKWCLGSSCQHIKRYLSEASIKKEKVWLGDFERADSFDYVMEKDVHNAVGIQSGQARAKVRES